jgi:hypothetical protein
MAREESVVTMSIADLCSSMSIVLPDAGTSSGCPRPAPAALALDKLA